MIEALIIEDEKLAAQKLKMLLESSQFPIQIHQICPSIEKSVAWLKINQPDLIFCDIHLEDGNAFKIFEQVKVNSAIIFTTAYDQYALKAFEQKSIDYLLKPIDEKALFKSLEKFQQWNRPTTIHWDEIKELIIPKEYRKRFLINIGRKYESIETEEIAYFYSTSGQTFIKTHSNRDLVIDDSLVSLSAVLDPDHFFHINRNFIIGLKSIDQMYKVSTRKVTLKLKPASSHEVIVPEEKFSALKKWLDR